MTAALDAEQRLRAALLESESAAEAIWRLHEARVGHILLSRAVATVFGLTLLEARQAVAGAVECQGIQHPEPQGEVGLCWPDREAGVLDYLERNSPLWQHQAAQPAAYQAHFLPSWEAPMLLSVELQPVPILKVLVAEPFSGPDSQGRVRVPRWPVPISMNTALKSWSAQALLTERVLPALEHRAIAAVQDVDIQASGVGIDGITILASVHLKGQVTRFRVWSPTPERDPGAHAFLSLLLNLTLDHFPQGKIHAAARDVAGYLFPRR
ncbi:hypothetical protein [Deinococcus hopiensis]|nr:hypothetical protein [Deinococcus hopiensis]